MKISEFIKIRSGKIEAVQKLINGPGVSAELATYTSMAHSLTDLVEVGLLIAERLEGIELAILTAASPQMGVVVEKI